MSKFTKLLAASVMAASFAAPFNANAAQIDSVLCAVTVVGAEPYQANFEVQPGVPFNEDFGTATRFKDFSAETQTVNGITTVTIDYSADVSVFDFMSFGTTLTLPNGRGTASANGLTSMASSTFGGRADYTLTCRRK